MVDRHVNETLTKFKNEAPTVNIDTSTSIKYLISFSNQLNWCNKLVAKPNSFIIATCLMYSLISQPIIMVKESKDNNPLETISFNINMDAIMASVFEIISEPKTYFEENGIWVEEKHPKVNISVPNGVIKNSKLHQRILFTLFWDEQHNNRTSILQFANLLHLIYLNCR